MRASQGHGCGATFLGSGMRHTYTWEPGEPGFPNPGLGHSVPGSLFLYLVTL